jgi:SAM-dependent methyltransferase
MQPTGERPVRDHTPPSLIALHEAGYVFVSETVGGGTGIDIGCGLGTESVMLARSDRRVIGIDYHAETASTAASVIDHAVCSDARSLPIASASLDWVCSSHIIEHFEDSAAHAAEIARVLKPGGVAVILTPNEPADFENPFHVNLFTPDRFFAALSEHFAAVELRGLTGSTEVLNEFERRRRVGRAVLRLDVFNLRHRLPHRLLARLHSIGRRLAYPILNRKGSDVVVASDFFVVGESEISNDTLVLAAIAHR